MRRRFFSFDCSWDDNKLTDFASFRSVADRKDNQRGMCLFRSLSLSLSLFASMHLLHPAERNVVLSHTIVPRQRVGSRFRWWFWEICSIGELDAFSHGVEGCCSARGCFQLKTKCVAAFRQPTTLALYGLYFSALSRCHAIPKYIRPNAPANICFVLLRSSRDCFFPDSFHDN